jgi:hypothetical protein
MDLEENIHQNKKLLQQILRDVLMKEPVEEFFNSAKSLEEFPKSG